MPKKILFLLIFIFSFVKMDAQFWSVVWSDEFSADTVNTNNWNFETGGGGWGNNELQHYTSRPENIRAANGNLQIIARQEAYNGNNYTSARITTKAKQFIRYGKIEARIKLPEQQGLWPAFWMLGENISQVGWPQCGEIDILEHVNKEANIHGTIHWDNNGHAQYGTSTLCDVSQFHVYGIEWDSTTIKWFLDSTEYGSANIANNINSTNEFHNPFFAILNMAVGGSWPGSPDGSSIFPDTLFVDYVRFYKMDSLPNVSMAATPTITASSFLTICVGDSIILSSSLAASYLWSTSDTSQFIVVKTGGAYAVEITDSLGGKATSDTVTVVVNALPAKPSITESGGSTNSQLTASAASAYQWYFEGSILPNENAASFFPNQNGNYAVLITDDNSCQAESDSYAWLAAPVLPPVVTQPIITASSSLTICAGDSIILSSSLAASYLWSTSDTSQSIVVKMGGAYAVEITDSLGGKATSGTVTVVVNALPAKPLISINGNVLSSSSGTNNQWMLDGVVLEGVVGPIYTSLLPGKYAVRVTNADSCSATSDAVLISLTGIYDLNSSNFIKIIPNPSKGVFSVETNSEPILKITIYNLWGKIIFETDAPNEKIDISAQGRGAYMLSVQMKNRIFFKKVFIQ